MRARKNLWRVFITINSGNSIVSWIAGRRYPNRIGPRMCVVDPIPRMPGRSAMPSVPVQDDRSVSSGVPAARGGKGDAPALRVGPG